MYLIRGEQSSGRETGKIADKQKKPASPFGEAGLSVELVSSN